MDSEQWTGDDDREFGPDPLNGRCHDCGAEENEPCSVLCACAYCMRQRAQKKAHTETHGKDAA